MKSRTRERRMAWKNGQITSDNVVMKSTTITTIDTFLFYSFYILSIRIWSLFLTQWLYRLAFFTLYFYQIINILLKLSQNNSFGICPSTLCQRIATNRFYVLQIKTATFAPSWHKKNHCKNKRLKSTNQSCKQPTLWSKLLPMSTLISNNKLKNCKTFIPSLIRLENLPKKPIKLPSNSPPSGTP
jgi:hypothetical protein